MSTTVERAISPAESAHAGYRTLWRWHFYAGLFVMPFLVVLAITGTLYCFQPQIEPLLYPHRLVVEPAPRRGSMPTHCSRAHAPRCRPARRRCPCRSRPRRTAAPNTCSGCATAAASVYVNPYDGSVLGTLSVENRFMQIDRMLHRKLLLGKTGELLMGSPRAGPS